MALSSRDNLKQYALRRLGSPVVEVNVDDQQMEDLMDDALQMLSEYHFDAVERMYLTHTVTQTDYDNRYITVSNNQIVSLQSLDLGHWAMVQQHLRLLQQMLEPEKNLRFNRVTNRLHIEGDWPNDLSVGTTIIVECYGTIDAETFTELYDNILLKKYVTALFKRQWGQNLSKFTGLQLPGGVEFNGTEIFDQANEEINRIEEEIQDKYELPSDFYTG